MGGGGQTSLFLHVGNEINEINEIRKRIIKEEKVKNGNKSSYLSGTFVELMRKFCFK